MLYTFRDFYTINTVKKYDNCIFVFGDNIKDAETGYVPTSTQAVIRGCENAYGIPTKRNRGTCKSAYFSDDDLDEFKALVDKCIADLKALSEQYNIVLPVAGIGTGKAHLPERAPECYEYLREQLRSLKNDRKLPMQKKPDRTEIVVCGSRDFTDYNKLATELNKLVAEVGGDVRLVSGGARGADKMAETYARLNGLEIKVFIPDWEGQGKRAGLIRNDMMLDYAQKYGRPRVVAFWDGESGGTKYTIERAKALNIPTTIIGVDKKPEPKDKIEGFFGKYAFMNNFCNCSIEMGDGYEFHSVEAAFQAMKDPSRRGEFETLTPQKAKELGKTVEPTDDWDERRIAEMRKILNIKFSDEYLADKLKSTGTKELIHLNMHGDAYWGVDAKTDKGENMLGKLLMEIRANLQSLDEEEVIIVGDDMRDADRNKEHGVNNGMDSSRKSVKISEIEEDEAIARDIANAKAAEEKAKREWILQQIAEEKALREWERKHMI